MAAAFTPLMIHKLSPMQINDLAEVGNIGAGNAVSQLSNLINRRCIIDLPKLIYAQQGQLTALLGVEDAQVVVLYCRIAGTLPSQMFVIIKRLFAHELVRLMTHTALDASGKDFGFTAQFALKQLADLLSRGFVDSLDQFLKVKSKYAMPVIHVESGALALQRLLNHMEQPAEDNLVIHNSFFDPDKTFQGQFLYTLNPQTQKTLTHHLSALTPA